MAILVTGGTGAMGSWATRRLVSQGQRPVCYDFAPNYRLLGDIRDKLDVVEGDVRDLPLLLDTVKRYKVDKIIHMAYLLDSAADANPPVALSINMGGMVNVLEASRLSGIERVVFTSSKSVYGDVTGDAGHPSYKPIGEDFPKNPVSIYGVTKYACEGYCQRYSEMYGLSTICLRFANTFGPGKSVEKHGGFSIPGRLLEGALRGEPVRIPSGGESRDDLLYYKDVAKSVVLGCFSGMKGHHVYNIGIGKGFLLQDVAEAVKKVVPSAKIEIGGGVDYKYGGKRPFGGYVVFDMKRASKELGFIPDYQLDEGFRDYADESKRLRLI